MGFIQSCIGRYTGRCLQYRITGCPHFKGKFILLSGRIGPIVGILESVCTIEVSAFQGCPQGGVPLYFMLNTSSTLKLCNTCFLLEVALGCETLHTR